MTNCHDDNESFRNRLTEYFRALDEDRAFDANDAARKSDDDATADEATPDFSLDSAWREKDDIQKPLISAVKDVSMFDCPQYLESLFLSELRGGLSTFLSVLGFGDEASVAKVRRILDSHFPTLESETIEMLRIMEHELARLGLGGSHNCSDLGSMFPDEGEKTFSRLEVAEARIRLLRLLFEVRMARLQLQAKQNEVL